MTGPATTDSLDLADLLRLCEAGLPENWTSANNPAAIRRLVAECRASDEELRQLKSGYDIVEKRCIDRGHKLSAALARVAELEAEKNQAVRDERARCQGIVQAVQRSLRNGGAINACKAISSGIAGQPPGAEQPEVTGLSNGETAT